jgi:hypothetical protein
MSAGAGRGDPSSHSVTYLIDALASPVDGERQRAAEQIWLRYVERLVRLAERRLSPALRRRVDPEDVLQSMYASFCARQRNGEYELADRNDLWCLLARITANKVAGTAIRHRRKRRDVRAEHVDALQAGGEDGERAAIDLLRDARPTPEEAVQLTEEVQARLAALADETLRDIARWKLAGFTDQEIAAPDKLNCAVRTVERKTARIRDLWARADRENHAPGASA